MRPATAERFAVAILASILLVGPACAQLPGFGSATPTPIARVEKAPSRPTVVVKKGSIVDSIKVLGRVSAIREAEMSFNNAGRLKSLAVQSGQDVSEGQLLAELDTGDLESRIATAQVNYDTAKLKLEQMVGNPADSELKRKIDLANAALAVQKAEADLAKAESDLGAAKAGPTAVETAEAAVKSAQLGLDSANSNLASAQKTTAKNVSDRENEANWYEANYGNSLARYNKGEISKDELDRQWQNLVDAKDRLATARLDASSTLAQAQQGVTQAQDALRKAQADLEAKKALPPDWNVKQAEQVVEAAKLTLEKAKMDYAQKQAGGEDYDVALQQKTVEQAKASLDDLKAQLADSRLIAPFSGKVMVARGKIGDQITALQPVVSISDPSELQVCGDLLDADIPRVALGQEASVTVDSLPGVTLKGTVAGIPGNFVSQGGNVQDRSVQMKIDWAGQRPQLGMLARVNIVVQKKDDVLVVPAKAIKTIGKRRFVEYMEGSIRRSANVEVGVVTDSDAEIVSGLKEGQVILSGQ